MKPAKRLFTESPYNFPDQQDFENFVGMSQKPRDIAADGSRETFPSQFAIGDKVKFRIGPTAEVDAVIYAARFEAATVWYDLIFDPYVGTPEQGGYTILTNVRSLMIHPSEFQERVKRITFKEAKEIKMKVHKKFFTEGVNYAQEAKYIVVGLIDNDYIEKAAEGRAIKVIQHYLQTEGLTQDEISTMKKDVTSFHFQNIFAELDSAGLGKPDPASADNVESHTDRIHKFLTKEFKQAGLPSFDLNAATLQIGNLIGMVKDKKSFNHEIIKAVGVAITKLSKLS